MPIHFKRATSALKGRHTKLRPRSYSLEPQYVSPIHVNVALMLPARMSWHQGIYQSWFLLGGIFGEKNKQARTAQSLYKRDLHVSQPLSAWSSPPWVHVYYDTWDLMVQSEHMRLASYIKQQRKSRWQESQLKQGCVGKQQSVHSPSPQE